MDCFRTYTPTPALAPYILYYWMLDTSGGVTERVIPFGHVQLIFHREHSIFSSSHDELQPQCFISGMSSGYTDLRTAGHVKMAVVAFRPEGARAFLNIPMQLFRNDNISVDDLEDKPLRQLGRQLCTESNDLRCIQMIENFFLKRLENFDTYNLRRILPAIRTINHDNQISISDLPDSACLSQKQFNRVFTDYIGATPKEFHRIIRFQRALFILQNHPDMQLTHLAYDAGYYDQSHLIKDFRQFTGMTPGEFLNLCAPVSDYFTYL